ncbi:MAG TPA: NAD(P)H-quinone oxidoreductase [Dehalococcoidia bacterium]|nr:NAD(P)H-quinone oxidoreductase [Dehalococcoidia bacterium]
MKAIVVEEPGDASRMQFRDAPDPVPGAEDVLVRVHASALNRADMLQRMGNYPAQHGASSIMGLELAGEVAEVGTSVRDFKVGDRVYGLSGGGGYAELASFDQSLVMPIPAGWDYATAASIPEVFFTANTALRTLGSLQPGERVLIHAGGSGIGIAGIQIAKLFGAEVWITAGSDEKCRRAAELGADVTINYRQQDFAEAVRTGTEGDGLDVIVDVIGADYWQRNLDSLAPGGRLVLVGLMGGVAAEVNLGQILSRRLQVFGTVMRSRPLEARAQITRDFQTDLEPALVDGRMRTVIDKVFPLRDAADAHRYMEANKNFGKIVLDVAGVS